MVNDADASDAYQRAQENEAAIMDQVYSGAFDHLFKHPLRDLRFSTTVDDVSRFTKFVAIDWSGASGEHLKGIAVAECDADSASPRVLAPPPKGWSRGAILDLLNAYAEAQTPALIGFDFSPSLPFVRQGAYFPGWGQSPTDMRSLWSLVDEICASDRHFGVGSFVDHEHASEHFRGPGRVGTAFEAGRGRLRICEEQQVKAKLSPSICFNLIGAAQVGKSSLTGMRVLNRLAGRVPLWPLDPVPASGPYLVEIYTTIAAREAARPLGRSKVRTQVELDAALAELGVSEPAETSALDDHTTDALITAVWLRRAASRMALWHPADMTPDIARTEGWTFGVT